MKYLNRLTRTLVDFHPQQEPVPAFFLFEGKRVKIDRVISITPVRKMFDQCVLYKCEAGKLLVELRWDKEKDRWFIEKAGAL